MRSPELKPCPFCGEDEEVSSPEGKNYGLFIRGTSGTYGLSGERWEYFDVECVKCGCSLSIGASSRDEAIAAWNRRTGEDELRRRLADTLDVADGFHRTLKTLFDNASYAAAQKRPPSHLPVQPSTPSTPSTT